MSRHHADGTGMPSTEHCAHEPAFPCVLGADVGGTWARLAWAELRPGEPLHMRGFRRYACAEHPSLAAILRDYIDHLLADGEVGAISQAVVAIAGLLEGDTLLNVNLPWQVSLSRTRQDSGLPGLQLINDFVAVAKAMPHAGRESLQHVCGDDTDEARFPALVLGPGTGLGVAVHLGDGRPSVLPSEGGHAALAAATPLEQDVLRLLTQRHAYVDSECVMSGPGLMRLYACLCELRGQAPRWQQPAELVQASREGDVLANECVRAFCGWLGSLAGDLALTFGARSVYVTGGVAGHLAAELHGGEFEQRFHAKGGLSPALARVPVWRVEHGELGVLGALAWHAEHAGR